ncbi:penicillin acylase family protein [Paraburkholderia sp. LEh10]|uniref:penicillin acylase family protein n=1 Tax=Paraburkholderia sp. LEh10 TaxID=2821353 RepID=UPI001AE9E656|nr:penicillin acylase family protein [Paraburkholderia sp. LEh10]MBP0592309.1 penicillin acylase family protein [Paraburkholderia sp. LEh10]
MSRRPAASSQPSNRSIGKTIGIAALVLAGLAIALLAAALLGGWLLLRGSLAQLDGTQHVPSLSSAVTIERDALGVPTIHGGSRVDVAFATGFLHAQDRFFQMDLLRRVAAGEVSALIGPNALDLDRRNRLQRFRARAHAIFAAMPEDQRQLIERYAAGVNAGLAALSSRPFEYWMLRTQPEAWRPEDSLLAVYAMYFDLQSFETRRILARAVLRDRVPADLYAFLVPAASHWDAPFDSASTPPVEPSRIPATRPDWLSAANSVSAGRKPHEGADAAEESAVGSNGWVVDGAHSAHGGAILASDMHLGLSLPNIWYRVSLAWPAADGQPTHALTGVSLPGTPLVIAGSNGKIAWSFTNSYGRYIDLIELHRNPADPLQYRTPDGTWARAAVFHERIDVKGGASVDLPVAETRWGPGLMVGSRAYALRWVAHDREAVNLNLQKLEDARTIDEALRAAQSSGIPTQNIMVADSRGKIGWTLAGPLPQRDPGDAQTGPDSDTPYDSNTYKGWQRYLPPASYPKRIDPPLGRLWTANNRVVMSSETALIGDAGADLGARASQIRDDLLAAPSPDESAMLSIQTDDRAQWIDVWRRVALEALDAAALEGHPQRAAFRQQLLAWNGRADADAVGYRLTRMFFFSLYDAWFGRLDADIAGAMPGGGSGGIAPLGLRVANSRYEAVMETLAEHHAWVPDGSTNWRAFMLDRIDHSIEQLPATTSVDDARWGDRNRAAIEHPFARLVPPWLPWVRGWLGAQHDPLPGDINMPRVQTPNFGASERMIVSPGREQRGIFEMPGGQSGHPLSPFFLAGHQAWVRGEKTSFLPGAPVHRLTLGHAAQ